MVGTPVARNATALVELAENGLGYDPHSIAAEKGQPVWKIKAMEAGKLNAAMKKRADCTLENLTISYDYCRKHKVQALTPYVLVTMLKKALEEHRAPEVTTDLETAIASAIRIEQARNDGTSTLWLGRFQRAIGPGRQVLYDEWVQADRVRCDPISGFHSNPHRGCILR